MNASTARRQIVEIQKKISDAEQELEQLETDTDESLSEKHNKINDRKRSSHLEKLNCLEEEILQRLEKISYCMDGNTNVSGLVANDVQVLKELMNKQNFLNNSEKSYEELKQDTIKLGRISNKLDALESKIRENVNEYDGNSKLMHRTRRQSLGLDDFEDFDENNKSSRKDLPNQNEDEESRTIARDYSKLKKNIEENEMYRIISILGDKLRMIKGDSDGRNEWMEESEENDATFLKEKLFSMVEQYNKCLINELKIAY